MSSFSKDLQTVAVASGTLLALTAVLTALFPEPRLTELWLDPGYFFPENPEFVCLVGEGPDLLGWEKGVVANNVLHDGRRFVVWPMPNDDSVYTYASCTSEGTPIKRAPITFNK